MSVGELFAAAGDRGIRREFAGKAQQRRGLFGFIEAEFQAAKSNRKLANYLQRRPKWRIICGRKRRDFGVLSTRKTHAQHGFSQPQTRQKLT
ncbi:MAG TPA: hypothetical protein VGL70_17060 [Candidatus Binatia bacterium]